MTDRTCVILPIEQKAEEYANVSIRKDWFPDIKTEAIAIALVRDAFIAGARYANAVHFVRGLASANERMKDSIRNTNE